MCEYFLLSTEADHFAPSLRVSHRSIHPLVLAAFIASGLSARTAYGQQEPPPPPSAPGSDTSSPPRRLSAAGETCSSPSDCEPGLKCSDRVCISPRLGVAGESCVKTADCNPPLGCVDQHCTPRGGRTEIRRAKDDDAPYTPDLQSMSKEESTLYVERMAVQGSAFEGMSGTIGFGYGGNLDGNDGLTYSAYLSQRYSRYFGFAAYLGAASGFDNGAVGAFGLHVGHTLFVDPMLGYIRPANYSDETCTYNYIGGPGYSTCSSFSAAPDAKLGMALAAGLELGLSRDWALTPMATVASTFDNFMDGRGTVFLFTIGPTARFLRREEFDDELKELRKRRRAE